MFPGSFTLKEAIQAMQTQKGHQKQKKTTVAQDSYGPKPLNAIKKASKRHQPKHIKQNKNSHIQHHNKNT